MPVVTHEVRNSLIDRTRLFRVDGDGLSWRDDGNSAPQRLSGITSLHLISYPNFGGLHLQCTLRNKAGKTLKIRSHHYASLGNFEDRSRSYAALVRALIAHLAAEAAAEGRDVRFYQGSTVMRAVWGTLFWLSLVVLIGLAFAVLGSGQSVSVGLVASIAVLVALLPFGWTMMRQARAGTFDPEHPPATMLGGR